MLCVNYLAIEGSVGRKARNRAGDVAAVQSWLNSIMPDSRRQLRADGRNGPNTMEAIADFQTKVVGSRKPDGRVDPGGRTLRHMNDPNAAAVWAAKSSTALCTPVKPVQETVPLSVPYDGAIELAQSAPALAVFFPHLKEREGVIEHFYCDSHENRLVTIGIGCLVDSRRSGAARIRRGAELCRDLMRRYSVRFVDKDGTTASEEEVIEDWKRVQRGKRGAGGSRRIAKLRIGAGSAEILARKQIEYFAGGMYGKFPFSRGLHPWVQMALIDARWNPAKINPWHSKRRHIVEMWKALDPSSSEFDPMGAYEHFVGAWKHKQTGRYGQRVKWRNARFREGAMRMAV